MARLAGSVKRFVSLRPTNCLSPIGEQAILSGLYQQIKGEFYTAVSRPPAVYRGNPFVIEAGLAYGRGPEITHLFGPPYSSPNALSLTVAAGGILADEAEREPGTAIWRHRLRRASGA